MNVVYVIGLPGSGKTTIVSAALRLLDLPPPIDHIKPIAHVRRGPVWHLGRERADFGGTDALPMNINPKACDWVVSFPLAVHVGTDSPAVLVGEGDRLANNSFFAACNSATTLLRGRFTLVHLDVPVAEARARMSIRARALGKPEQDASWWKGRVTKVNNLVAARPTITLDGMRPAAESAADLAALLAG